MFLYQKLQVVNSYKEVASWTKRVDVFSYDVLLYPIYKEEHWCIVVVDMLGKTISYYDSNHVENTQAAQVLGKGLASPWDASQLLASSRCWPMMMGNNTMIKYSSTASRQRTGMFLKFS